jgi:hypothetical protein
VTGHRCYRCGHDKPASEFVKKSSARDGLSGICKPCKRADDAEYRKNNKEKLKAAYHKMIEDRPTFWADYYARHRTKELLRVAELSKENPEKKREMYRAWYENNPEYHVAWRLKNIEKCREKQRRAYAKKQATPRGRLENSVRAGVHKGILRGSKVSRRTFDLLGYTSKQLMAHLEKKFDPHMSWENYGAWHIDHKIPLSAHNYETPDDIDFKRAWALKNLQPMWGPENISKGAKLAAPFQPSLTL